jgi:hypothetical protein
MDTIRPESARPAPYVPAQRREWIVCDEPGIEGFAILVRTSITNAEKRQLEAEFDEIVGPYSEQWNAMPPEERDLAQSPRARERELLARQILDWNVVGTTEEGEEKEIAAPAINGAAALDFIEEDAVRWIGQVVLVGYLATGKADPSLARLTGSGGPSVEAPDPGTPQPKSSSRQKS